MKYKKHLVLHAVNIEKIKLKGDRKWQKIWVQTRASKEVFHARKVGNVTRPEDRQDYIFKII